jgi:DNA topoisomerase IB
VGLAKPKARSAETAAVQATATLLGNTPSVARASYIHPAVPGAAKRGRTVRDEVDAAAHRVGSNRLADVWTDPGLQSAVRHLLT